MSERLEERLRRAARTYRRLGNHTAEGMFLEAADTICELQTENAKLRETLQRRTEQFEGMAEMWVERGVENYRLRELVRDMYEVMVEDAANCDVTYPEQFDDRIRELGVEK